MPFYQMMCCNFAITTLAVKLESDIATRTQDRALCLLRLHWHMHEEFSITSGLFIAFFVYAGRKRDNFLDDSFLDLKK